MDKPSGRAPGRYDGAGYFVAGERDPAANAWPLLADDLCHTPRGVAAHYVERLTRPGDLVLDPYGMSPGLIHETLASGRWVLVGAANPVARLALRATLSPPRPEAIAHALARLGDAPRADRSVQQYVRGLYATSCPNCLAPIEANFFVWEREAGNPVEKGFHCPACGTQGTAAVDAADIERAHRIESRGFHFYFALDRAAPTSGPVRERLSQLIESYPPRALHALVNLLTRLDRLTLGAEERYALSAILLAACDAACPLHARPGVPGRPTHLGLPPTRYREVNVWLALEDAAARLSTPALPAVPVLERLEAPPTAGGTPAVFLVPHSARGLAQLLMPGTVSLLLTEMPRLDPTFWALSALWSAWLWGPEAARPLFPALEQHQPDPDRYGQGLRAGLMALQPALADDGSLAIILTDAEPILLESTFLAISDGWRLSEAQFQGNGHVQARLLCRRPGNEARVPAIGPTADLRSLTAAVEREIAETVLQVLRLRAEPVGWTWLQAAIHSDLARSGRLAEALVLPDASSSPTTYLAQCVRAALIGLAAQVTLEPPALEGEEEHWWLADWDHTIAPLADRVEAAAIEVLTQNRAMSWRDFAEAIYRRFPGLLTPPAELIQACFSAYAPEHEGVLWPQLVADLVALGRRLGFVTLCQEGEGSWPVIWEEESQPAYAFTLSDSAILGPLLLNRPTPPEGCQPCLVLPAARSKLAAVKLRRDGRMRQAVNEQGWLFAKAHLIRQLAQSPAADRHVLKTIWGLDPIVEQGAAQIPLL